MQILDCTLRDGGYYTNWDFDKNLVKTYIESLNNLPVDYIEIGYRSFPMNEYLGQYFYCPKYVMQELKTFSKKKLVVALNEKDINPSNVAELLEPCKNYVTMVRVVFDPQNIKRALLLAEVIKKMGFEVGFNIMYMSKWKANKGFIDELKYVDGVADFLYMVDSYGGVYPHDIIENIGLLRNETSCKIGFHGHNNMELALINTLTAIDSGAEIVDVTITGMGRGAGNLKTELLLTALNSKYNIEVDFDTLSQVVERFSELQETYSWGTNLPYMISGSNSLPQKDVMEWVSKRFYSFNSIVRALNNKPQANDKLPIFQPLRSYKNVLIIGGGNSALHHISAIKNFISLNEDICIIHASSKNSKAYRDINVDQFFCLVGNEGHRLETVFNDLEDFNGICILPPSPRKMGTYIPNVIKKNSYELNNITITNKITDSHTIIALETANVLKSSKIYVTGYDGYFNNTIEQREQELFLENDFLFKTMKDAGYDICSISPSKYTNLDVLSVYSFLI